LYLDDNNPTEVWSPKVRIYAKIDSAAGYQNGTVLTENQKALQMQIISAAPMFRTHVVAQ
jgi:hypothetical protein